MVILKVGLTRFHPTSRDKSDKMRYKHKFLNNFPTKKLKKKNATAQSWIIIFKSFVQWPIFVKKFIEGAIQKAVSPMADLMDLAGGSV